MTALESSPACAGEPEASATAALAKAHVGGTHRLVSPHETLARIQPQLATCGITRCADITGLDRIGIPVYVAVRPQGRILQTANGKGLTDTDARVSALMEAIEHWHAEHRAVPVRRASHATLAGEAGHVLSPRGLEGAPADASTRRQQLDWIAGEELCSGEPAWLPAYAAYYERHQPYSFSFNGLASGNHIVEATLHALYEIVERDTLAALAGPGGRLRFDRCRVIAAPGVRDPAVGSLVAKVRNADLRLALLRAPSVGAVHTMIAVLVDPTAFSGASTVNFGAGAHLSPAVAAVRAITEAAQARLTFIHGSRDDLQLSAYRRGPHHDALAAYFGELASDSEWAELEDCSTATLTGDVARVLAELRRRGHRTAYRADLGGRVAGVSAVKVVVPRARVPDWI